jgi:hypothetical protein
VRNLVQNSPLCYTHTILHSLQFAAGFFGVQEYSTSYHQLIEIESPGFNSTLAPYYQCPNANNAIGGFGAIQAGKWASTYTVPIIKRLQPFISGVNLTATDIVGMQQTCAYEACRENVAPSTVLKVPSVCCAWVFPIL